GVDGERRRAQQTEAVAEKIDALRAVGPEHLVVVGGDLNRAPDEAPYRTLVSGAPGAAGPRLLEPLSALDAADRYSYRRGRTHELLDHVLVTPTPGVTISGASIPHINTGVTKATDGPAGASDHDPVLVQIRR
ncbi:MAG: endonuclease, partial [Thermoleophilia bacterium]|nr:endonuclease [Thermoleophilia bacterium]